jgi:AMP phosphorylase
MLNEEITELIGVKTKGRIFIKTISKNPKSLYTIIDLTKSLVGKKEIAVSSELKERLSLHSGQIVDIDISPPPKSLAFIKKKMNKEALSQSEIDEIIKDVVNNSLSEAEISLFISGMYENGMTMEETICLIKAILGSGRKLILKNKFVVDKHCIGWTSRQQDNSYLGFNLRCCRLDCSEIFFKGNYNSCRNSRHC